MTMPTRQTILLLEKFGDPRQLVVTEADVPEPLAVVGKLVKPGAGVVLMPRFQQN